VITHANADHAYPGCGRYLATSEGETVLRARLGPDAMIRAVAYGEFVDIDGVLILAQRGGGKRASLYTDDTFGVWDPASGGLVPIAKAYSGLTDEEIRKVDSFARRNMVEKFGPDGQARAGLRTGLRGAESLVAAQQVGDRRPVPAHPPVAD
jgi:hypothetical protein